MKEKIEHPFSVNFKVPKASTNRLSISQASNALQYWETMASKAGGRQGKSAHFLPKAFLKGQGHEI